VATRTIAYRDRSLLPRLGVVAPKGPVLLDSNVFINALAGRAPPEIEALLANLRLALVSGATVAELSWTRGRLDPAHPDTARVLAAYDGVLRLIEPTKILTPSVAQWAQAGELAGRAARGLAGGGGSIKSAFDRIELINDAVTAIVSLDAKAAIVTQDGDFDLFQQLEPALEVVFYD
jgi:predicted nucleic acid-binding protein